MTRKHRLPEEIARRLGRYYVYVLIDPRNRRPFYVGKGSGQRLTTHGNAVDVTPERGEPKKSRRIRAIRQANREPQIDVVRRGIESEEQAYEIEAALIDTLPDLVNRVRGCDADRGRQPLDELVRRYGAPELKTRIPLLLIRLGDWESAPDTELGRGGHGYEFGMSLKAIYGSTRGWWRVSPTQVERARIQHAVAVYQGVTRAVFAIDDWLAETVDGRHAFVGRVITSGPVWDNALGELGRRVPFVPHAQNSVNYWPR